MKEHGALSLRHHREFDLPIEGSEVSVGNAVARLANAREHSEEEPAKASTPQLRADPHAAKDQGALLTSEPIRACDLAPALKEDHAIRGDDAPVVVGLAVELNHTIELIRNGESELHRSAAAQRPAAELPPGWKAPQAGRPTEEV